MNTTPAKERLHALDSLRAFAMLLGVFFHGALSFMATDFGWAIMEEQGSIGFDLFVLASHGFRMQLFFLLAGFFGALLLEKFGTTGFILHRLKRIALPLLLGMVLLLPPVGLVYAYAERGGWTFTSAVFTKARTLEQIPTGHLWFLEYLLCVYLLTLGCSLLFRRLPQPFQSKFLATGRKLFLGHWKILFLAIPVFLTLQLGKHFADVPMPGYTITPIPQVLLYYWIFFGAGWLLYRCSNCHEVFSKGALSYVFCAIAVLAIMIGCLIYERDTAHPMHRQLKLICNAAYSLYNWLLIFGITGLFLRYFNSHAAWSRYLADAAYWIYLVHLPIIIYLQVEATKWQAPLFLKFAVINLATLAFLLLTYQWFVRYTWIGRILNGPRAKSPPQAM